MIELVIVVFLMQFGTLTFYYIADRELQFLSKSGIKQYEQITLTKWNYLFVYYKRKEGLISKFILKCMIVYYITNGAGFWLNAKLTSGFFEGMGYCQTNCRIA